MLNDENIYKIGKAYAACTSLLDVKRTSFTPLRHIHNPLKGLTDVYIRVLDTVGSTPVVENLMRDAMDGLDDKNVSVIPPQISLGNWWIGYYHYKYGEEHQLEFHQKLKIERTNKRLTQKKAAELLDITLKTYMNWEEHVSKPNQITQDTVLQKIRDISQSQMTK